jgi:hypothetical protein
VREVREPEMMLPSNESVDAYIGGMQYGRMLRTLAHAHCGHILDNIEQIEDPEMRLRLYVQIALSPIPEQLAGIRERAERELSKTLGLHRPRKEQFRPPTRKQQLRRLLNI